MRYLVKRRAHVILSKIYFDDIKTTEIILWINQARRAGIKSQKLDEAITETVQTKEQLVRLFFEILKDGKIRLPRSAEKLFKKRSLNIAILYLEGQITATVALSKILIVIQNSDYKDDYYTFIEFCQNHDLLTLNLEFQNIELLEDRKIKMELDSIFLSFAESCHRFKLRVQLEKKPIEHIVLARRYYPAVYGRLSLLIMDDIIAKSGLDSIQLEEIYRQKE